MDPVLAQQNERQRVLPAQDTDQSSTTVQLVLFDLKCNAGVFLAHGETG